jgi:hypothetical protein
VSRFLVGESILDLNVGEEEDDVVRDIANKSDGASLVQTARSELLDGLERRKR